MVPWNSEQVRASQCVANMYEALNASELLIDWEKLLNIM
jgi:hypothetical protein